MAIPMYTFYELGIIGARWFGKKKENVASEQATTTASAAAGHP